MKILVGECEVLYQGRGHTWLPPYKRMIIMKADGSIAVHSDSKYQPLNYMPKTDRIEQYGSVIQAHGNHEVLTIMFTSEIEELDIPLNSGDETDPGLVRSGTEQHLHQWLETHLHQLSKDLRFLESEFNTGNGSVDILAENTSTSRMTLVEVKRVATSTAITQVRRYVEAMQEHGVICDPVIVALEFKQRTVDQAAKHHIRLITAPPEYWIDDKYTNPVSIHTQEHSRTIFSTTPHDEETAPQEPLGLPNRPAPSTAPLPEPSIPLTTLFDVHDEQ